MEIMATVIEKWTGDYYQLQQLAFSHCVCKSLSKNSVCELTTWNHSRRLMKELKRKSYEHTDCYFACWCCTVISL